VHPTTKQTGRDEQTIGGRLVAGNAILRKLPTAPFEPCHKCATKVSFLSLARDRSNDYPVPTTYGFRDALAKGFVDEVVIFCEGLEIAPHALLEQKPGALDQAAPPQGWTAGNAHAVRTHQK
jgi:hypothetical protein